MSKLSLISLLLLAALLGCHKNDFSAEHIFRYNESAGITSLDPVFAKNQALMWPAHQLFSTLLEIDDSMKLQPLLAKSWSVSSSGTLYTFILRKDVFFHDDPVFNNGMGRRMVAADVAASFTRLIDPAVASPGAWIFNDIVQDSLPFIAINDSVFQIRLKQPYAPLLKILTMPYCSVVAPDAVRYYGKNFRRHPVGTGPFQLLAWDEGKSLILKKNPHYFEKDILGKPLPYLNGIQVSFIENKAAEILAFRQGDIDFINDIDAGFKDELLTKTGRLKSKWMGKATLHVGPYLNTEYLGILSDSVRLPARHPLRQLAVRKAISMAIDKQKMMLYLRNSIGSPAWEGFVPPSLMLHHTRFSNGYNPSEARLLLKQAGYDEQHPMEAFTLMTVPSYTALGSFVVNELNHVGFHCRLEVVQKSLLLQKMSAGQVVFFRGSWIADYPDAVNYMSVFYSKNPSPPNYTRYNDAVFDSLYELSLQVTDENDRQLLFDKMTARLNESMPVIPMWYDKVLHLSQPNLTGFHPNVFNMLELRRVKK